VTGRCGACIQSGRSSQAALPPTRVVVTDPPGTSRKGADACGIVVVGAVTDRAGERTRALRYGRTRRREAMGSMGGLQSLRCWNGMAVIVWLLRSTQGGEMAEAVLRQVDPPIPYRLPLREGCSGLVTCCSTYEQGVFTSVVWPRWKIRCVR
jgi:phage terminase large subunit-like protein